MAANDGDFSRNKYITVRIDIPIEIFADGNYVLLDEYLNMEFIPCDSKPVNLTEDKKMFLEKYQKILSDILSSTALSDPLADSDEESESDLEPRSEPNTNIVIEKEGLCVSGDTGLEISEAVATEQPPHPTPISEPVVLINPTDIIRKRVRTNNVSFRTKPRPHSNKHGSHGILRRFTIKNWRSRS